MFFINFILYVPFVFAIGDLKLNINSLIVIFCACLFLYRLSKGAGLERNVIFLFFVFFSSLAYFLLISIQSDFDDLELVEANLRAIGYLVSSYTVAAFYVEKYGKNALVIYESTLLKVSLIHCFFVIFMFFFHPFRDMVNSVVYHTPQVIEIYELYNFRGTGLTIDGGALISATHALFCWMSLRRIFLTNQIFPSLYYLLLVFANLLSVLILSRSGVALIFFFWICYLILPYTNNLIRIKLLFTPVVLFVLVGFAVFLLPGTYSEFTSRSLEIYFNMVLNKEFATSSTSDLSEMYIAPELGYSLFGDGNFGRSPGLPYIPSDVGFVRILFGAGYFGLIVFVVVIFYVMSLVVRIFRKTGAVDEMIFLIGMLFVLIILNFKERFDFGSYGLSAFILTSYFIIEKCSQKVNIENKPEYC